MRYVRIFFLYLQDVIEYRGIAFVWFLASLINPLLYLTFWRGAVSQIDTSGFASIADVNSYYLLYLVLSGFLMTHIEHDVAYWDIKEGGLTKYILKPMQYITAKFFLEFTWRLVMGFMALTSTLLLILIFGQIFTITLTGTQIVIVIFASILGLLISFVFKMIIGLLAFWVVDFGGIEQVVFVFTLLFSGFVVPLEMTPRYLQSIAAVLPIPYMVYYPIRLLQGKMDMTESMSVIFMQMIWLVVLSVVYKLVWTRGIKRFTGVGL